ncbi:uncharacterized protein LOC143260499 isoform X1 [Megalopta genalis]|uniref:uncharacterized protein LOC143260499 isoform X1 n=1 Tax=Megalopta genalis TaxID=115081 RepID=UPI003FCFB591
MSKFSKSWRKRRETEHRVRVQREVEVLRETPMLQRATILFPVLRGGPLRWSNIGMLGATALIIENEINWRGLLRTRFSSSSGGQGSKHTCVHARLGRAPACYANSIA